MLFLSSDTTAWALKAIVTCNWVLFSGPLNIQARQGCEVLFILGAQLMTVFRSLCPSKVIKVKSQGLYFETEMAKWKKKKISQLQRYRYIAWKRGLFFSTTLLVVLDLKLVAQTKIHKSYVWMFQMFFLNSVNFFSPSKYLREKVRAYFQHLIPLSPEHGFWGLIFLRLYIY